VIHDIPLCFSCRRGVSHDPIFAAPCDHAECPSVVFHPLCLMDHRENWERRRQDMGRFMETHTAFLVIAPKHEE
jgi:hypothetical protein